MAGGKKFVEWGGKFTDEISGPAADAAAALDSLRESMEADREEMAALRKAMSNLKGGGEATKDMVKNLRSQLEAKRISIAKNQAEYIRLGGSLKKTESALQGFKAGLQALPGPIGYAVTRLESFFKVTKGALEKMPKARMVAMAFGLSMIALAGGLAVATKNLTEHAIAAGDARRSELLAIEAHTRMRNLWGVPPGKSKEMQESLDRIAPTVSIARGELAGLQAQLYQAGLRGQTLDTVLEAAAIKQSALGSAAGSAFAGFAASVHLAGGSVNRMAQDVKNRFGDVVREQMKSVSVQALKAKENMNALFDIDVHSLDAYLTAQKRLDDIFSLNTEAGKELKDILTSWTQPVVNGITKVSVWWRRFVKQMIIGVTELEIAWLSIRVVWERTFGWLPEGQSLLEDFFTAVQWGKVLVYVLAAAFLKMAVGVVLATWPFLLLAAAVWGALEIINLLYTVWKEIDWADLGKAVWDGLVGGIKSAFTAVKNVFTDLGNEAVSAFKSALGIASPSKVFAELGVNIPKGVALGIKQGAPEATAAAASVVTPPAAPNVAPVDGGQKSPAAASRNITLTIEQVTVNTGGDANAKDIGKAMRRELESVLQGLAVQLGAGV